MKKFFSVLLILTLVFSFNEFSASAATISTEKPITFSVNSSISPRIVHSYTKTIKKTYSSASSIPEKISYTEYNDEFQAEFSGILYLKSTQKTASGYWQATFSGNLVGRI